MDYKHIQECWTALSHCYDLEEMQDTIQDFPIWSGDWDIQILDEETVRVSNTYFDSLTGMTQTEEEDFDIKLTRDAVLELIPDAVEIDLTETGCATNVIIHEGDKEILKELVKQALDLYSENQAEESAAEYFMQLVEDTNLFVFYDFEYDL